MIRAASSILTLLLTAVPWMLSGCQTKGPAPGDPPVATAAPAPAPAANPRGAPITGERNPDITPPRGSWLQARHDANDPTPLPGGPVRVTLSRQAGDVRVNWSEEMPTTARAAPAVPGGNASPSPRASPPARAAPGAGRQLLMHNGRIRLRATDATVADAATTQDSVDLEASWQDDRGNTFAIRCSKAIPGSFTHEVFGGVVTNRVLDAPAAPAAAGLPAGYAYVAFWGIGETSRNGQVQESNVVVQGVLTEATPGQRNHPPMADPLVAARLRLHVLAGPVVHEQGHYIRRPVRTGFSGSNGKPLPFWHVTFDSLTVQTERNGPAGPKRTIRPSLAGAWLNAARPFASTPQP